MNSGESSGESSSSGRENGAASSDIERPHKKARFPWQIKGKHHLKNQADQLAESPVLVPAEPELATPECSSPTAAPLELNAPCDEIPNGKNSASLMNDSNNTTKSTKRLIWQGYGRPPSTSTDLVPSLPLETVISLAESMILRSEAGCSHTLSQAEIDRMIELSTVHKLPIHSPGPSKVSSAARDIRRLRREEEKCISRWQAAQTIKGCFDNTINRVLESWMSAPAAAEERFLALDFARIMNNLTQIDDNVENEGILMAINAHGLQSMGGVPLIGGIPLILPTRPQVRTLASDSPISEEDSDSSFRSEDFEISSERGLGSLWPSDEHLDTNLDQDQETNDETIKFEPPWRQSSDNRNTNQSEPYQYYENNRTGEDSVEYEFLNSAVIQAIKSKGLMAAGTDFG